MDQNDRFTQQLYGDGLFLYSIDNATLPAGFIKYHKANFANYYEMDQREFCGLKILDTGSGPCKHAIVLAIMGADVVATDLAPANLKKGMALAAHYGLTNISFRQHNLMEPVEFGTTFDLVTAHNWMQHAKCPAQVLKNIAAVTKLGGGVYLSLYHGGTFRFFIAQIARSLLRQKHYQPMRDLVRYAFPTGFKEFNNPEDIYLENIFDDFFVPYCHTTSYDIVLHDAKLLGFKLVGKIPGGFNCQELAGLDNIPLRICLEKVEEASPDLRQLKFVAPADEFFTQYPLLIRSAEIAKQVVDYLNKTGNVASICCFCLGLYRVRAQLNTFNDAEAKHGALQKYLDTCLDEGLRNISHFYDSARHYDN